ncbi:calcium-responsive transcription factor-like [Oncorhynchus keta]|uniref:calcium-responsive transcription factor-like n=1 Tax=Oncorhynchus keta TaxID=8018 RepID=UPI00227D26BC|nr:calcium-responsive transcription factor-like [Oncorhynchus keta]
MLRYVYQLGLRLHNAEYVYQLGLRLHNAERIGDSYRGYCNTDTELETILLLHKQQTNSVFGTRQSPSPAKPASRLMWKSQYVPYDGVPFVNAGSRAIVMECQYGPRRKGLQPKKTAEQNISPIIDYKATCPARIYIKKVCKFPQHRVPTDPNVDKRVVRQEQEKAFFNLRKTLWDVGRSPEVLHAAPHPESSPLS